MLKTKESVIDLDGKVSPAILASIFGCNVSLIYQDVQAGKLPSPVIDHSYRECIQFSRQYHIKNTELKLVKQEGEQKLKEAKLVEDTKFNESKLRAKLISEEAAREAKKEQSRNRSSESFGDDGLPPLLAAKAKQDIRLGIAREQQLWVKAEIERGGYISTEAMVELCEPMVLSIRQTLLTLALTSKEAEGAVDVCMESLYSLGESLVSQASFDADNFLEAIMKREVDYTEIDIDSLPEPIL